MAYRDFDDTRQLRIRLNPTEWDAMLNLMHTKGAASPSQLIRDYINGNNPQERVAHDARNNRTSA